jgi:threonine aldolase
MDKARFFSDNAAPVHPAVWDALRAADSVDTAYDGDQWSARLNGVFSDLFEAPCHVFAVATGTAANCLSLAALCPPHRAVLCHAEAHIEMDEAGAPGFFMGGAKLMLLPGTGAKIAADTVTARLDSVRNDVHQVQAAAISITQATEYGLAYTPDEVAAIGDVARSRGLALHMDGARFANAVAHLGCAPADVTWRAGVDVLSFGCVKNGGMNAEAIVVFERAAGQYAKHCAEVLPYLRKRAGHLQSKGRYHAAQLLAMVDGGLWLDNARAANAAAAAIATAAGGRLLYPCQANEVFMALTRDEAAALRTAGFDFYDWGVFDEAGNGAARFVASWQHEEADVVPLAAAIKAL